MAFLAPVLKQRFFNANGDPLVGGKLYSYVAGTTTLQDTYVDQTGSSTNTNPIILDANGEADVWISDAGYKFALYDSANVLQWSVDNVYSSAFAANVSAGLIDNLGIACSVATNQLTIALKDAAGNNPSIASSVKVGFRSPTLISGVITKLVQSAPLSIVISAGSTLGHQSAVSCPIYVGVMNISGAMELCVSKVPFDEKALISTTAEGGAGAADSGSTIYSTVARSNVSVRMIGKLLSTQTTAGTWAVVPTNTIVGDVGKILSMPTTPNWGSGSANSSPRYNQFIKSGINDYEFSYAALGEVNSYTTTATADIYTGLALCSGSAFTLTLPTAVGNFGKMMAIVKTDSSLSNIITLDANSTETIDGQLTTTLNTQYESILLKSNGSNWFIVSRKIPSFWTSFTPTGSWNTNVTYSGFWMRVGDSIIMDVKVLCSGAPNSVALSINLAGGLTMDTGKLSDSSSGNLTFGSCSCFDTGVEMYGGPIRFASSTSIIPMVPNVSGIYLSPRDVAYNLPFTFGNTDFVSVLTRPIPIAGWKG